MTTNGMDSTAQTRNEVEALLSAAPCLHYCSCCEPGNLGLKLRVPVARQRECITVDGARDMLLTTESTETIRRGIAWTRQQKFRHRKRMDPTDRRYLDTTHHLPSTYWFKHVVEAATGEYVSNGQNAVVAILAGLPVDYDGDHSWDLSIWLTDGSWKKLDTQVRGIVPTRPDHDRGDELLRINYAHVPDKMPAQTYPPRVGHGALKVHEASQ